MPFRIPSFAWSQFPTNFDLDQCRTAGVIQPAIVTFAGKADFTARQPANALPPENGPAKWWSDMNRNTAIGYFRLTGKSHKAGMMSAVENRMYSSWARMFYTERPNLDVPEVEYVVLTNQAEWQRLSFEDGFTDPEEYPLGLVWDWGDFSVSHAFPTDVVLFMLNGLPCFDRVSKALEVFPLTPQMPVGPGAATTSGYTASEYVAGVKKALSINTRASVVAAITAGGTDVQIAERVAKL